MYVFVRLCVCLCLCVSSCKVSQCFVAERRRPSSSRVTVYVIRIRIRNVDYARPALCMTSDVTCGQGPMSDVGDDLSTRVIEFSLLIHCA